MNDDTFAFVPLVRATVERAGEPPKVTVKARFDGSGEGIGQGEDAFVSGEGDSDGVVEGAGASGEGRGGEGRNCWQVQGLAPELYVLWVEAQSPPEPQQQPSSRPLTPSGLVKMLEAQSVVRQRPGGGEEEGGDESIGSGDGSGDGSIGSSRGPQS